MNERELNRIEVLAQVDDELPQLNGYFGMTAQRSAAERRARRRKLVRIPALREAVIDRLQEGWSPEQIAGRLKFEGRHILNWVATNPLSCWKARRTEDGPHGVRIGVWPWDWLL